MESIVCVRSARRGLTPCLITGAAEFVRAIYPWRAVLAPVCVPTLPSPWPVLGQDRSKSCLTAMRYKTS